MFTACKSKTEQRTTQEKYSSGKIKTEFVYADKSDSLNYLIYDYFENGKIEFKGIVENGKFVGQKTTYYENGNTKQIDSLDKPCLLDYCCCDGKVTKFDSTGLLDESYYNKNGVADGLVTLYDSLGKVQVIHTYSNGKLNGLTVSYYPSGKIYSTGTYRNDTLIGFRYYFKENGDSLKYHYAYNETPDFPYKKWLENGQVLTGDYTNAKHDKALYIWFDSTGKEIKRQVAKSQNGHFPIPE